MHTQYRYALPGNFNFIIQFTIVVYVYLREELRMRVEHHQGLGDKHDRVIVSLKPKYIPN